MRVGIVEICEPNHYTAVLALAQTYTIKPDNEVVIFTTETIAPLLSEVGRKVEIIIQSKVQAVEEFLSTVAAYPLDRIHINTISKYYKEFASVEWHRSVYFTVHNIDLWYDNSLFKRSRTLFSDYKSIIFQRGKASLKQASILYIKDFWRQRLRNKFTEKISGLEYKILVYSKSQKQHLEKYLPPDKILVFPFCLHTGFQDLSYLNNKIRLCIPGSVCNQRRNYVELFEMLPKCLAEVKDKFSIDLLGYISLDSKFLIDKIKQLIAQGYDIIYNEDFIEVADFNKRLSLCDLILGNLNVQLTPYRKYGETKETGVIFNIIKSGKPGVLPYGYPVDDELADACLFFDGYHKLAELIIEFTKNKPILQQLKERSKKLVTHYQPERLYILLEA